MEEPDYLAFAAGLTFVCTLISASFNTDALEDFRKLFQEWGKSNRKGSLLTEALIAIATIGLYALLVSLPLMLFLGLVAVAIRGGD